MKLRNALAAGAGLVGTVALANRALRTEGIEAPLGREQSVYRWRGFDVAYTEAGDPDAPDLVLLHGINAAGSSHEFRYVIDDLAERYHVLAPDLPGFGHSDRPPLLYSESLYTAFVGDFLSDTVEDPTVVASSLSGAYAAVAARENDLRLRELVLVCPTAETVPGRRVWLRSLLRSPVVGEALFNLLVSKPSIRYFLADHGFADPDRITDEWVAYDWQVTHRPGARYAPASFVSGFLDPGVDLGAVLGDLDAPVTVAWGREADLPPLETGRELADRADARLVVFDDADLLPHAEFPDEFADMLTEGVETVAGV